MRKRLRRCGLHPNAYKRTMFDPLDRLPTGGGKAAKRAPEARPDNEVKRILGPRPVIAFMRLINIARGARFQTLELPETVSAAYRLVQEHISPSFTVRDANNTLALKGLDIQLGQCGAKRLDNG